MERSGHSKVVSTRVRPKVCKKGLKEPHKITTNCTVVIHMNSDQKQQYITEEKGFDGYVEDTAAN